MASFVSNINTLASKIDVVEEANSIFDEGVIPILEEIAELDLQEAVSDLKKGNYLGNRKIDINLALNMEGIDEDLIKNDPDVAEAIWVNPAKTVQYDSATITFVDGEVITLPFEFDGNPTTVSTHGDLLIQLNAESALLAKLETTLISGFASDVVGEIVRVYDVIGQNSNIERIRLHAVSGAYKEENPIYYWAKTTSAFQTLSMRAGDIIKLGNEIDNLILLANSIEQVLELQSRIPEFIDTYVDDVAQGDVTIYNKLTELQAIYDNLTAIIEVHSNLPKIDTLNTNIDSIVSVAEDLDLGVDSKIVAVGANIDNILAVYNNEANITAVADNETNINAVVTDIIPNLAEILATDEQAAIAIANADLAIDAKDDAETAKSLAESAAATATAKSDEIKAVSVGSTITGAAGTNAAVTYNPTDGKFTFIVPQGVKGDKGDSFEVNAVGMLAQRSLYDAQQIGFSFLSIDEATIYFKLSNTSGDWSLGAPFGKGETGDTGATGNGIVDITFTSSTGGGLAGVGGETDTYTITYTDTTTDTFVVHNGKGIVSNVFTSTTDGSGLPAQNGATDTYTITYTNGDTTTYEVYNGLDSDVQTVAGRTGDVTLVEADITDLDKYTQAEVDTALGLKANSADVYTQAEVDTALATKQDTLVSGTNIKTLNGGSLLGSGDITVSADLASMGVTATATELNYVDGVVSPIQTQLSGKISADNYATSTVGGTVKVRLNGTTAYFTNNGTTA